MLVRACAVGLFFAVSLPAHAQVLADSVAEFSGTQGHHGWLHGYYSGSLTSDTFQAMENYNGVRWYVQQDTYWTFLGPIGAHPNGSFTTPPAQGVEQWPARRWISDHEGDVNIDVRLAKIDTNIRGNGVTGRLFVDGLEIWNQWIATDDATGVTVQVPAVVALGSTVDFVLDPVDGNDGSDATRLTGVISAIPSPGAIVLIGAGALTIRRRR